MSAAANAVYAAGYKFVFVPDPVSQFNAEVDTAVKLKADAVSMMYSECVDRFFHACVLER